MAWMSNYSLLFDMTVITYPCPNPDQLTSVSKTAHALVTYYEWVSARKTKLQCVSNEVMSFLH